MNKKNSAKKHKKHHAKQSVNNQKVTGEASNRQSESVVQDAKLATELLEEKVKVEVFTEQENSAQQNKIVQQQDNENTSLNDDLPMKRDCSLGEILRRRREELKIDIADVSKRLCVKPSYIIGIENNDFSTIAQHLYVAGLIQSYARVLRINQAEIEDKIKAIPSRSNVENKSHQLINVGGENDLSPHRDLILNTFFIFSLLMLIMLSLYHSYNKRDNLITDADLMKEMEKITVSNVQ